MLVAVRIADTLKAKGISQKRFAEMTGRTESEISEWLSGNRNFTIDTLSDIKKYLGLDLLNVSAIRTAPVAKDAAKIKVAKKKTLFLYDMSSVFSYTATNVWLSASWLEHSIAL